MATSLPRLFLHKLKRLDEEIEEAEPGWDARRGLSLRILRRLVGQFAARGALAYAEYAAVVGSELEQQRINVRDSARTFEKSAFAHGVLEFIHVVGNDKLRPDEVVVEPGFDALVDFLLADELSDRLAALCSSRNPITRLCLRWLWKYPWVRKLAPQLQDQVLPESLRGHSEICSTAVAILLRGGISILERGLWRGCFAQAEIERWHARAILNLEPEAARRLEPWARQVFSRDMPSCRMLVAEVLAHTARNPHHPFSVAFLHDLLSSMPMTERDLVWSGPDELPGSCGGPWEGTGDGILDHVTLHDDDDMPGMPLLVAWITSSVIQKRRARARSNLAVWGSGKPDELAELIKTMATVNDPQVVEDVTVACAGAAMRQRVGDRVLSLANAVHSCFFSGQSSTRTTNAITRHAARLVIERAVLLKCPLGAEVLESARPPYPSDPELLLPIDRAAAEATSEKRGGSRMLMMDLDWYVAEKATDPFFELQRTFGCTDPPSTGLTRVSDELLQIVLESPAFTLNIARRAEIEKEIHSRQAKKAERQALQTAEKTVIDFLSKSDEQDAPKMESPDSKMALEKLLESMSDRKRRYAEPKFTDQATELLARYGKKMGLDAALSPKQLRSGLIEAMVRGWGWNESVFHGDPRGEAPGEKLGADIAILRRHSQASHGARSPVAMFVEKYVWCAVNIISGYLADRLPSSRGMSGRTEVLQDHSSLGAGMPDPFVGKRRSGATDLRAEWIPHGLFPEIQVEMRKQPGRAARWLSDAGWPSPETWFADHDSVALCSFLAESDLDNGVDTFAWTSCCAVSKRHFEVLRHFASQAPVALERIELHDAKGILDSHLGLSPTIGCWLPWVGDVESNTWSTVDRDGEAVTVEFLPMASETCWEGDSGECHADLPSKLLRGRWHVVDATGGDDVRSYVNGAGEEVAYFQRSEKTFVGHHNNSYLQVDRERFLSTLRELDLVPVWGVRVRRELRFELSDDHRFADYSRSWLVLPDKPGGRLTSVLIAETTRNDFAELPPRE